MLDLDVGVPAPGVSDAFDEQDPALPQLCNGKSNEHVDFPGAITLSTQALADIHRFVQPAVSRT